MILKPKGVHDMTIVRIRNGVDLEKLSKAVGEEKADPSKAQVRFSADTKWLTNLRRCFGAARAPNAVEIVLAALGACLSVGFAYSAASSGHRPEIPEVSNRWRS
jgi:hypothetical protein